MRGFRWARLALLLTISIVGATAAAVAAIAVNELTRDNVDWFPTMHDYGPQWLAGATAATAVSGLLLWQVQRQQEQSARLLSPAMNRPESWVVERPAELARIVNGLRRRGGTVGITTAVLGAGGFGKTTLARMVCDDPRVRRHFHRQIFWVTVGRDTHDGTLVEKVNGLVRQIDPGRAQPCTDLEEAAACLAMVLAAGPRRLIVVDDVWSPAQLAAFPVQGRCVRLVTTRIPSLITEAAQVGDRPTLVTVDQMSDRQARRLLTGGLDPAPPAEVVNALLDECGRWPLLLRLVNRRLAALYRSTSDPAVARDLLDGMRRAGGTHVDRLAPYGIDSLVVGDPRQRASAVAATIEASASMLVDPDQRARFDQLAVFAEDEAIPLGLAATLWDAPAEPDLERARVLCSHLADLALLELNRDGTIGLHDVVRDHLRDRLGAEQIGHLHRVLLDATARHLPREEAPADGGVPVVAWWRLPTESRYLREHLIEHLLGADRDAAALATDLRWVASRLREPSGVLGSVADLTVLGDARAARLCHLLTQSAHLYAAADPQEAQLDILYGRVAHDPGWGARQPSRGGPVLASLDLPPDLPPAALTRVLNAGESTRAIAIAPDCTWLVTGSVHGEVRIWDTATGEVRRVLDSRARWLTDLLLASDGTWFATIGDSMLGDNRVRLWDVATGARRATLRHGGRSDDVVMAIAPDSSWLATGGENRRVLIWDTATGARRATLRGHTARVYSVAIAPDGTWLATGGGYPDCTIRIWDAATGACRAMLRGHTSYVSAVAIAPTGTWLASSGRDDTVRIWDASTGAERAVLREQAGADNAPGKVTIAPDGSWLAALDGYGRLRIWDAPAGTLRATLNPGIGSGIKVVAAAPDSTWLATGGGLLGDRELRIWDTATGGLRAVWNGHDRVRAAAIARDGAWLATGGQDDYTVRIWDTSTRQHAGGSDTVDVLATAPDGSWLATSQGFGSELLIRDARTGAARVVISRFTGDLKTVAGAPDGAWLVTIGRNLTKRTSQVRVWEVASGALRVTLDAETADLVAIAPDSTWLATSHTDGTIQIWDAATGARRAVLTSNPGSVSALAIAADGSTVVAGDADGTIKVWKTIGFAELPAPVRHPGAVRAVAIDVTGGLLATAGAGTLQVAERVTGANRMTADSGKEAVTAVALTADGAWLATAGGNTVRVWETATGRCRTMVRTERRLLTVAWDPREPVLIVTGAAGRYRFAFRPGLASFDL